MSSLSLSEELKLIKMKSSAVVISALGLLAYEEEDGLLMNFLVLFLPVTLVLSTWFKSSLPKYPGGRGFNPRRGRQHFRGD